MINQPGFLTRPEREEHALPDWPQIFKGRNTEPQQNRDRSDSEEEEDQGQAQDHLCLTCSQIESKSAQVIFDINSFLGFIRSLAFA